jgi:hypothetical protein
LTDALEDDRVISRQARRSGSLIRLVSSSMAAEYMCIAASAIPTITGASPPFGVESATATRFLVVQKAASDGQIATLTDPGRRNGNQT